MKDHTFEKHDKCDRLHCPICEGGLSHCTVCGGLEGSLPTECPGRHMTAQEIEDVYAGKLDFFAPHGGPFSNAVARWWRSVE